ncbi:MAG: hypothetical protein WCF81_03140 [Roseiarcus sp.]
MVQFIDPALEIEEPVQCMVEMSGMLDLGMPNDVVSSGLSTCVPIQ